ncbi:hypothetical protein [Streptomyces meridianus]|uniref:Calcineurin-like phosphoesterase domain-containing protein n=1 Tax=Streptomyces meridianus TaxID=2938945 RepID=A0ABT0XCK8_9ACTN|nr:hypothetical protein [Streptomyces meridianus]MCM2580258.1 hypothetical protein [Streptomyces meridianus]
MAEYRQAVELLAPPYERHHVLLCPGNHDSRAQNREVLLDGDGTAPVNEVRDIAEGRVLMCDSSIPGRSEGLLEPETLSFFALATERVTVKGA